MLWNQKQAGELGSLDVMFQVGYKSLRLMGCSCNMNLRGSFQVLASVLTWGGCCPEQCDDVLTVAAVSVSAAAAAAVSAAAAAAAAQAEASAAGREMQRRYYSPLAYALTKLVS
jgi:hypothetical protein